MSSTEQFQSLVNQFELRKPGAMPFDATRLDESSYGASHGEKASICFLLNVWDPGRTWKSGKFDALTAIRIWDSSKRTAFAQWAQHPFWP